MPSLFYPWNILLKGLKTNLARQLNWTEIFQVYFRSRLKVNASGLEVLRALLFPI